ncbi:MAG: tripartite tricarboxylate transporter substrate binding protein [Rhodospirillales bacterium]|nr:tripartite tricarboxylate transporter substrate binding protein [Rhodospirillales bacterium]
MSKSFSKLVIVAAAAAVSFAALPQGQAMAAPEMSCRNAKVIVPWKPGGETDIVGRIFIDAANKAGADPKLQIVNVPGQGGNKGAKEAKKSKPDGCTLFFMHESAMTSYLTGRVDFNHTEFVPVALFTRTWAVIGANKNVSYNDLKGLAAAGKKNPKGILAGATLGSTSQISILVFADAAGIDLKYVSYDGTRDRMTALLAGNIQLGQVSTTAASKYIKTGEMKALGILSPTRNAVIPDVPTAKELGINAEWATSRGVVAPKGTPKSVVDYYSGLFKKAGADPEVIRQMKSKGTDVVLLTGDDYGKFLDETYVLVKKLADKVGLTKR